MTPTTTLDSAALLAAARRNRAEASEADAQLLEHALAWAELHRVDDPDETEIATFGDTPISLAGDGAPHVSHFAVIEFGAVLGMSRRSVESLIADVLDLGHRLPLTWARVTTRSLKSWRARHIAQATHDLSAEAAAYVDQQVAAFATRISPAELQRLIDSAIVRFMPEYAQEMAELGADSRNVTIDHKQISFFGTSQITGELDFLDALDLEKALQAGAEQLKELGSELGLDARRAAALGNLARGELTLDLQPEGPPTDSSSGAHRTVVLYVHLSEEALLSGGTGYGENPRQLLTSDQIRDWCGTSGKLVVKPVLDLAEQVTSSGYQPSERLREQVVLRDRFCVFPYCERDARNGDLDHIEPYDPDGPPDQTRSENLAGLCRFHHRLKTHSRWTYTAVGPGTYLWRSPHGYSFLRDGTGTRDLTPRPVDPPGA